MGLIRVEGHTNLYRDESTGAIVNTDNSSYTAYRKRRASLEEKTNEIHRLTNELNELKMLVKQALERDK